MPESQPPDRPIYRGNYKRASPRPYFRAKKHGGSDRSTGAGWECADLADYGAAVRAVLDAGGLISAAPTGDATACHVFVLLAGTRYDYYAVSTAGLEHVIRGIRDYLVNKGGMMPPGVYN